MVTGSTLIYNMAHAIIFYSFQDVSSHRAAGPYAIASVLRNQGLDVLVVPNCSSISFKGVKQIIENNSDNLLWVGVSTTFSRLLWYNNEKAESYRKTWATSDELTIPDTNLIADINKSNSGFDTLVWYKEELNLIAQWLDEKFQCPLIVGGVNDLSAHGLLLHRNIHSVIGYAENYVKELTENLLQKKKESIPFINNNSSYDDAGFKTSSIHWNKTDLIMPDEWLPLEVSRGCAFNCAYCSFDRKSMFDTYKNPENLRQEIIRNYEQWGVTRYMLIDDLYNDSKEKVRVLYDKVWSKLPFKVEWASYMRLDMFWSDPESIDIVKASGARAGGFGIETLHDVAGRKVGKGLGKTRILETLQNLKEKWNDEILVSAFLIAGLPHEPWDSILETWEWAKTTDLVHGTMWQHFVVVPPHYEFRVKQKKFSRIDQSPDEFGISWPNDSNNWINSVGVTRDQCIELVGRPTSYPFERSLSFQRYASLRYLGWDHWDIVNIKMNSKKGFITWDDARREPLHAREVMMKQHNKILALKS